VNTGPGEDSDASRSETVRQGRACPVVHGDPTRTRLRQLLPAWRDGDQLKVAVGMNEPDGTAVRGATDRTAKRGHGTPQLIATREGFYLLNSSIWSESSEYSFLHLGGCALKSDTPRRGRLDVPRRCFACARDRSSHDCGQGDEFDCSDDDQDLAAVVPSGVIPEHWPRRVSIHLGSPSKGEHGQPRQGVEDRDNYCAARAVDERR
jgi:hypothetical protein